jgi:hypothetical protein
MKSNKTAIIVLITIISISLAYVGISNNSTIILSKQARIAVTYMQQTNATKTFNFLKSLTPPEKYEVITWAQKNPEKVEPFYYMYFADDIFVKNKDEAALWFFIGRLRSTEDVQMCKDKTATAQVGIYTMFAPKTIGYIASKTKEGNYMNEIIQKAVKWDEEHSNRVSPIWSCFHGIEAFSHYPELLPMSEYKKIQEKTRKDVLASTNKKNLSKK